MHLQSCRYILSYMLYPQAHFDAQECHMEGGFDAKLRGPECKRHVEVNIYRFMQMMYL